VSLLSGECRFIGTGTSRSFSPLQQVSAGKGFFNPIETSQNSAEEQELLLKARAFATGTLRN